MNAAQVFKQTYDEALAETVQRLSERADTMTVEEAFCAGWKACLVFNQRAEILERDVHSEAAMIRHTAIRPTTDEERSR